MKNKIVIAIYAIQTAYYLGKEPSISLLISFLLIEYVVMAIMLSVMRAIRTKRFYEIFMNLFAIIFFTLTFLSSGYMLWTKVNGFSDAEANKYSWADAYGGSGDILLVGLVCFLIAFAFELRELKKGRREGFVFMEFFYQSFAIVLVIFVGLIAVDITENPFLILTWMITARIGFEFFSIHRHKKARIGIKA